jgi:cytochrome c biogenesis protein ResB
LEYNKSKKKERKKEQRKKEQEKKLKRKCKGSLRWSFKLTLITLFFSFWFKLIIAVYETNTVSCLLYFSHHL